MVISVENEEQWRMKEHCRICRSQDLVKYFDFGPMPLVDSFIGAGEPGDLRVPLEVMYCHGCSHSQLSMVVNPKILFSDYLYHSSVSNTYSQHCALMARELQGLFNGKENLTCLDIASNDGCLLKEFKREGYKVIGVDPATNLCALAEEKGIPSIADFWGLAAAKRAVERVGKLDVITATNVFAHVDDLHSFLDAVYYALADKGILVIEFPYLKNLIKYNEFDTIYHEHLSYFLVKPLLILFPQYHLHITNLSESEMHGGTIRVQVAKDSNTLMETHTATIKKYLAFEEQEGLHTLKPYLNLEKKAQRVRKEFTEKLQELKSQGKKIAGYGASAKGNTFINYCRLDQKEIQFIVDDTKHKQGRLYAGTRIPVVSREWLKKEKPDYVLILPWNFAREIMEKNREYTDNGGRFIVAIPELKII